MWWPSSGFKYILSSGSFGTIAVGSQIELPYRGSDNKQVPTFSFCSGCWVVHSVMSSSAVDGVAEVVASVKSCSSTGSLNMQLNKVVWGHWLVDPRWIAPKPWTTCQWLKVTCSCTASLSSTMLPTKGQRSRLLGRLSFSAQYCRPLV